MINEYNEISYAEKILQSGFITNKRMYEINLLAKYFYHNGLKPKEVQDKILDFCNKNFENFNEIKYFDKISSILSNAKKQEIVEVGSIKIYNKEIDSIKTISTNTKVNQVIFCLYVIKKIRTSLNQQPYLNCKYTKFAKMCGLSTTKSIYPILKEISDMGLVRVCRNSNLEILIDVCNECDDDGFIIIKDFDNIYTYYLNYIGKSRYIECTDCGRMVKVNSNRQTYCKDCQAKRHREINKNLMKKNRKN